MTGISGVDIPFNNTGTVDLQTGTLSFESNYTQIAGSLFLDGGLTGTSTVFNIQGGDLRGSGTVTGNVNKPYDQAGNFVLAV